MFCDARFTVLPLVASRRARARAVIARGDKKRLLTGGGAGRAGEGVRAVGRVGASRTSSFKLPENARFPDREPNQGSQGERTAKNGGISRERGIKIRGR